MGASFYDLSPDLVFSAVERAGFAPSGHILALNSYENRVYDLRLDDGAHVVGKFYRPGRWSREQVLEEHAFLRELADDEIPALAPLPLAGGGTLGEADGILYALWARCGGRAVDEPGDDDLRELGRLLARLHNRGAAGTARHRPTLGADCHVRGPLAFLLERGFLPAHCRDRYEAAARELAALYEALAADVPTHRIHGDCHLGNLLRGAGGWFFLDFDDFVTGPAVQDVWMLVPARDREGERQRAVLLEGYATFREFSPAWLGLIEPLRALRYVNYAAWIARRWEDPAFPAAFPHFGTAAYWEENTADLEDQLERIHARDGELPAGVRRAPAAVPEEKELTNKDFFWDWPAGEK